MLGHVARKLLIATVLTLAVFAAAQRTRANEMMAGDHLTVGQSLTSGCCAFGFFGPGYGPGGCCYILTWTQGATFLWNSLADDPCCVHGYGTHTPQSQDNDTADINSLVQMQSDGNLVLYDSSSRALWSTNTSGNSGAFFNAQNDGNIVVYSSSNAPLWSVY